MAWGCHLPMVWACAGGALTARPLTKSHGNFIIYISWTNRIPTEMIKPIKASESMTNGEG